MSSDIKQRKADHLDLCATDEVSFRQRTTLLECVRLVHQSLPEADFDAVEYKVYPGEAHGFFNRSGRPASQELRRDILAFLSRH